MLTSLADVFLPLLCSPPSISIAPVPYDIVTATTKIANGDEFLGTLMPDFDNCLQR